jgi:hypothetical protein
MDFLLNLIREFYEKLSNNFNLHLEISVAAVHVGLHRFV